MEPEVKILLRRVEKAILKEPRRMRMNTFGDKRSRKNTKNIPPCATQACIGGHIVWQLNPVLFTRAVEEGDIDWIEHRARQALQLTQVEANRLFLFKSWNYGSEGWPKEFSVAYNKAKTPHKRAKVAVARIEHFIRTDKKE